MWYKYKLRIYDRNKNYQIERNAQEKELGLIKYKLKEYEKLRDEGPDTDVDFPPQFSSIGEFVEALLESGQVLDKPPLEYTGKPLSSIDAICEKDESVIEELNTYEKLGEFEFPPEYNAFPEGIVDLEKQISTPVVDDRQKYTHSISYEEFIEKLKLNDPGSIITYTRNIYHYHPSNFEWCCTNIVGLTLHESLLTLKWYNDQMHQVFKDAYEGCIVKAKVCGLDLSKTYVADCKVIDGAKVQALYKSCFIKGRGRAGATDNPITAHLRVVLQQRETPFKFLENDPIERIKARFRRRVLPITRTPEDVCNEYFKNYPKKVVYVDEVDVKPTTNMVENSLNQQIPVGAR